MAATDRAYAALGPRMGNVTFDRIECNLDLLPDAMNFTKGYLLASVSKPSGPTQLDSFS